MHFRTLQTLAHAHCSSVHIGVHTVKMAATSRSSNVVNHYGQGMSAPASAVTVQVLSSSSPATQVVSRGGSVNNEKVNRAPIKFN